MTNQYRCATLKEDMRLAWLQHVYWTRLLIVSITERLDDQQETTARLLQNPKDIAAIFARFYSCKAANEIDRLLTEHLTIGAGLITASRDGDKEKASELDHQWYLNADQMAKMFHWINPCYNYCELRKMLFVHLDLTKKQVGARLAKNHKEEIETFGMIEKEALMMADEFVLGIM
ncbi:MAG: acetylglutamate kinase [Lachnospiraceae bacterium]|nr:acetylglutamate kinase [Lachnospiraceae bacterium]